MIEYEGTERDDSSDFGSYRSMQGETASIRPLERVERGGIFHFLCSGGHVPVLSLLRQLVWASIERGMYVPLNYWKEVFQSVEALPSHGTFSSGACFLSLASESLD